MSFPSCKRFFRFHLTRLKGECGSDGDWSGELTHIGRDGKTVVIASRWSVQRNAEGVAEAILEINRDITEQKRAQEALRKSEESYRLFVSQSSEGIFRSDLSSPISVDLPEDEIVHHILYEAFIAEGNDALAAMYGLESGEQLRGKRWRELAPPEEAQNVELTRQYVRSGFRVLGRESHEVDVHGNPKVFLNSMIGTVENGMLVSTWGIQRDITEKIKLEREREQADSDLRQIVRELSKVTAELAQAKEKLSEEKLYLEEAIDSELGFGEIIGRSGALKDVMQKVAKWRRAQPRYCCWEKRERARSWWREQSTA